MVYGGNGVLCMCCTHKSHLHAARGDHADNLTGIIVRVHSLDPGVSEKKQMPNRFGLRAIDRGGAALSYSPLSLRG